MSPTPLRVGLPALLALTLTALPPLGATSHAATTPNGDVVANLFEWNWNSVAAECTSHLGPAGFGAVEVAPPQESVSLSGQGHPWWEVYQPVSYNLTSRFGNRDQFAAMVTACHNAGVGVIVDAVVNHMAGDNNTVTTDYGGSAWSPTGYTYATPGYGYADFHHPGDPCPESDNQIANWDSQADVQECELLHLSDLYTEHDNVRTKLAGYLNDLISLGVDGFRVDAAKHINPTDLAAIEAKLNKTTWQGTAPYVAQEVFPGSSSTALQYAAFEGNGSVLNFDYSYDLKSAFTGSLSGLNSLSGLPAPGKALSFVTNHDTERNGSTLSYKSGTPYTLATYFLLAYPQGRAQVYDGFDWSSSDQSPPSDSSGYVTDTACGSGWECLHRTTAVTGMVGWHNTVGTAAVANWTSPGSNVVAFSRGSAGWFAVNDGGSDVTATFTTGLADGGYCDVITGGTAPGGCAGTYVGVSGGQATVTVPANGAVAIDTAATTTATAPSTSAVTFNVYATTTWGTNVYVAGSIAALGTWDTSKAVPLSAAGYPTWSGQATVPAGTSFEYKYIKKDENGNVTWENGANRVHTPGSAVSDTWR